MASGNALLFGSAQVHYQNMDLDAECIVMNMDFAILDMSLNLKKLITKAAKALVTPFAPVLGPCRRQNAMIYAHHKRILRDFTTAA